jgi:hypothetical protein
MLEVPVAISAQANLSKMERIVEASCAADGLRLTLKTTLAKYPGSVHWHFKSGDRSGTLEITLWSRERRLWFAMRAGRTAAWVDQAVKRLKPVLAHQSNPRAR